MYNMTRVMGGDDWYQDETISDVHGLPRLLYNPQTLYSNTAAYIHTVERGILHTA